MNRGVSWCWGKKCTSILIFWKKKNHKKTYFRLFDCSRRYSLFTYLPSVTKKKKEKIRGGGEGHFLYYHGLFLDNTLGFETAKRLLKYLKNRYTGEQ